MSVSIGNWPTDHPQYVPFQWEFYLRPNSNGFRSPVTRSLQVVEGQGQMWIATGSWRMPDSDRRAAQKLAAFLDKLRGTVNYCMLPDFADRGRVLGPCVDVSSLGATEFDDDSGFDDGSFFSSGTGFSIYGNWPIGARQVLVRGFQQGTTQIYAGDNLQLGNFLYRLTEDTVADGLGRSYLYLNRPLMERINHGDEVITTGAATPMRLMDDDQTKRSLDSGQKLRVYTLSFEEVFFLNEIELLAPAARSFTPSPNGAVGDYIVDDDGNIWTLR